MGFPGKLPLSCAAITRFLRTSQSPLFFPLGSGYRGWPSIGVPSFGEARGAVMTDGSSRFRVTRLQVLVPLVSISADALPTLREAIRRVRHTTS